MIWRHFFYDTFLVLSLIYTAAAFVGTYRHICHHRSCCVSNRNTNDDPAATRRNSLSFLLRQEQEDLSLAASKNFAMDGGGGRSSTTRKKKKKRKKAAAATDAAVAAGSNGSGGLSEEELADHVSNLYIHGPRGILRRQRGGQQRDLGNTRNPTPTPGSSSESNSADYPGRKTTSFFDRRPVLVLNADYRPLSNLPLSLWNWQEAVKSVFSGKVTVVDVYPDVTIRAVSLEIPLPSVIALNEYVKLKKQKPAFTKRNVFLRDEYRCQYCNERFATNDLSIDHVVPRCQGGRLHWENAATCCLSCNGRKGSLRVEELTSVGMRLLRKPSIPSQMELASIAGRMRPSRGIHETWFPYLGIIQKPETSRTARYGPEGEAYASVLAG